MPSASSAAYANVNIAALAVITVLDLATALRHEGPAALMLVFALPNWVPMPPRPSAFLGAGA